MCVLVFFFILNDTDTYDTVCTYVYYCLLTAEHVCLKKKKKVMSEGSKSLLTKQAVKLGGLGIINFRGKMQNNIIILELKVKSY